MLAVSVWTDEALGRVGASIEMLSIVESRGLEGGTHLELNVVKLLGNCFVGEAPEAAVGPDRRAGKWGLVWKQMEEIHEPLLYLPITIEDVWQCVDRDPVQGARERKYYTLKSGL
jgi:hypothetical protein